MKRRLLLWRVYPYYLVIIVLALALTAVFAAREMRVLYVEELAGVLEERARLVEPQFESLVVDSTSVEVDRACKERA